MRREASPRRSALVTRRRCIGSDTLAAGAALCDAAAVEVLVEEGPARVRELQTAGAEFDLDPHGRAEARPRGGALDEPDRPRARRPDRRRGRAHAHRARAGEHADPRARASARPRPRRRARRRASACARASPARRWRSSPTPRCSPRAAAARCIATRRIPMVATGDGYAIAHRAGVTLADMEFVQFHPTALDTPENPLALISEAVRGEGAILVNENGVRFMLKAHRDAELAPRDVVARAIFRQQKTVARVSRCTQARPRFREAFPRHLRSLRRARHRPAQGSHPRHARRALHDGRHRDGSHRHSSMPRLYAVGEVARTGVHGANRLASNSLLEGLVFAERVARDLANVRRSRRRRRRSRGRCLRSPIAVPRTSPRSASAR